MISKRLRLADLRRLEDQADPDTACSCLTRLVEMTVDELCSALGHSLYGVQFWRDVDLYGLREAVVYLGRFARECGRDPNTCDAFQSLVRYVAVAEEAAAVPARQWLPM